MSRPQTSNLDASVKQQNRYAIDPVFRRKKTLRSSLTYHLRKPANKGYKGTILGLREYLGTSIAKLRQHIELQFTSNMTWANYGTEWEVDHIVPLSTAKTIEEVEALFVYTNLRPLLKLDNRTRVYM